MGQNLVQHAHAAPFTLRLPEMRDLLRPPPCGSEGWARIGRELESSANISQRDFTEVLAGRSSYDELSAREQGVVRAEWAERMTALREGLNLEAEFTAAGEN